MKRAIRVAFGFLSLLGLLMSILFYVHKNPRFYYPLVFTIPYPLIFLINQEKTHKSNEYYNLNIIENSFITSAIAFFAVFLALNGVIYYSYSIGYRPHYYYVFCAILISLIIAQILFSDRISIFYASLVLLEIVLFGIALRASLFFLYPGISGMDPHYHLYFINKIILTHHIPILETYSSFPVFHIIMVINALVGNLGLKNSYFMSSIFQVISIASIVYLIGKFLFSKKNGLLSALFVVTLSTLVKYGTIIIPNTMGSILFGYLSYLIIIKNKNIKFMLLWMIFYITLIFTHHLSSFMFLSWFFTLFAIISISKFLGVSNKGYNIRIMSIYMIISVVLLVGYWITAYAPDVPTSTFLGKLVISMKSAIYHKNFSELSPSRVYNPNVPWTTFLGIDIPYLFLDVLMIIGIVLSLSRQKKDSFILGSTSFLLVVFVLVASSLNIAEIIPFRWFMFIYILGTPVAIYGIEAICKTNIKTNAVVWLLVTTMILFSITSPYITYDNPLYGKNSFPRWGFYTSEITAGCFINLVAPYNIPLKADGIYSSELSIPSCTFLKTERDIIWIYPPDKSTYSNGIVIIRLKNKYYPSLYSSGLPPVYIEPRFFLEFTVDSYLCIYDNPDIKIYT